MDSFRHQTRLGGDSWSSERLSLVVGVLLALLSVLQFGCSEPSVADNSEATGDAEPFEFGRLQALPDLESLVNQAKPGHWVSAHQRMMANSSDFQGSIRTSVLDLANRPIPTEMTSHVLTTSRPISLSLGEPKDVELMFYIPRRLGMEASTVTLEHRLLDRRGQSIETQGGSVSLMPEYRFFHVVLSQNPARYTYLKTLPTNQLIHDSGVLQWTTVVTPQIDRYLPLPSDVLAWTSISAIFWDDLDPERLDPDQRLALIDWLHFGGQLILSGPDALDRLKGSFLEPYLPSTSLGSSPLTTSELSPLLQEFDLPPRAGRAANPWLLRDEDRVLAIKLSLHPRARFVPRCSNLVADRAIGRGRVVASAFSLHERGFREWNGVDNFVHNALLLRPRRDFSEPKSQSDSMSPPVRFVDAPGHEEDPRMSSSVRFFARDWGREDAELLHQEDSRGIPSDTVGAFASPEARSLASDAQGDGRIVAGQVGDVWRRGPYLAAKQSGIAGWNDRSQVATEARRVLDAATGIEPPSMRFVATALAIYLIVLVPVNALLFRAVRRVEWAWIAAPMIAIVAAVMIARAAQLDVGFARSRTELVVMELAAGHPRAHVTRFTTLYTSLSTEFELEFDSEVVRAQPWGDPALGERLLATPTRSVSLERSGLTKLAEFDVASNSAGLMHTEELIDVKGALNWVHEEGARGQVENRTELVIRDAVVVAPLSQSQMGFASIERIGPGEVVQVTLQAVSLEEARQELWRDRPEVRSHRREAEGWFDQLDLDQDGRLSLTELRSHPDFSEQWVEYIRRLHRRSEEAAPASQVNLHLDLQQWISASRLWLRGRLNVGGLLELWFDQVLQEPGGPQLAGLVETLPETSRVIPSPSQVRQVNMIVAALEPIQLPDPGVDVDLPLPSLDLGIPGGFENSLLP